jgi:hypothetical protein
MIDKEILKEAIDTWGSNAQADMMIEEASELIRSIQKFKRANILSDEMDQRKKELIDEIADNKIMIAQMEILMHDQEAIDAMVRYKMNRLKLRLIRANEKNSKATENS